MFHTLSGSNKVKIYIQDQPGSPSRDEKVIGDIAGLQRDEKVLGAARVGIFEEYSPIIGPPAWMLDRTERDGMGGRKLPRHLSPLSFKNGRPSKFDGKHAAATKIQALQRAWRVQNNIRNHNQTIAAQTLVPMNGTIAGAEGWYSRGGRAYYFVLCPVKRLSPDLGFWRFECVGPIIKIGDEETFGIPVQELPVHTNLQSTTGKPLPYALPRP
jgi:hypothetical protein